MQDVTPLLHVTQSLAALEVAHAAAGLVRSPVFTTVQQVASRLFVVWGILYAVPNVESGSLVLFRCSVHSTPPHLRTRTSPGGKLSAPKYTIASPGGMLTVWTRTCRRPHGVPVSAAGYALTIKALAPAACPVPISARPDAVSLAAGAVTSRLR